MFSNWPIVTAGLMLLRLDGCGLQVDEPMPGAKGPQVGSGTQCLQNYDEKIANYFIGKGQEGDISQLCNCLTRALDDFMTFVRPDKVNGYGIEKLRSFLIKVWANGQDIPAPLTNRIVELAKVFLDAPGERHPGILTLDNIRAFQSMLEMLGKYADQLQPYLPLTPSNYSQYSRSELNERLDKIHVLVTKFSRDLPRASSNYEFKQLDKLFEAIQQSSSLPRTENRMLSLRSQMNLFRAIKALFLSPPGEVIEPERWEELFMSGFSWYTLFLRFQHLSAHYTNWSYGDGLQALQEFTDDLKDLIFHLVNRRPSKSIPAQEFDNLMAEIVRVEGVVPNTLFQEGVGREQWVQTLSKLFKEWIRRMALAADGPVYGLQTGDLVSESTIQWLWGEGVDRWIKIHHFMEDIFRLGRNLYSDSAETLDVFQFLDVVDKYIANDQAFHPGHNDIPAEVARVATQFPAYFEPDQYEILFPHPDPRLNPQNFHSLSLTMTMRVLYQMAVKMYASDPNKGLKLEEVHQIYLDLLPVGVLINFFDPRNSDSGLVRAREADLLSFKADGNSVLTADEGMEMILDLVSAKALSGRIYAKLKTVCTIAQQEVLSMFPEKKPGVALDLIDSDCFLQNYYRVDYGFWKRMPGLEKYFKKLLLEKESKNSLQEAADAQPARSEQFKTSLNRISRNTKDRYKWIFREDLINYITHPLKGRNKDLDRYFRAIKSLIEEKKLSGDWLLSSELRRFYLEESARNKELDKDNFLDFIKELKTIAAKSYSRISAWVERSEVEAFALMPQYLENIFRNFDENHDDVLQGQETKRAYGVFKNFIKKMAAGKLEDADQIEALFYHLLEYGQPPEGTWDQLLFKIRQPWNNFTKRFSSIKADRLQILVILENMARGSGGGDDLEAETKEFEKIKVQTK